MGLSAFFSSQARKPSGLFGRLVMSAVFNIGNANINRFVYEMMSVKENDHILEIGFGTGKLMYEMAGHIDTGLIEGVDFSEDMVSIARRKNKGYLAEGKVRIHKGNFDDMPFRKGIFAKACSVNTIYFWQDPDQTARKIANILEPGGMFVTAFEDIEQLEKRQLSEDIFRLYSTDRVKSLLIEAGFSTPVHIETRKFGSSLLNCAVAMKT
ncbi:MAG: class I SAM-dependent methyltransferase [Desulfobacteraceae bacterium]|nr:class I SAM-dependent methyltransferase [Desulfobacteraceae bacterium]